MATTVEQLPVPPPDELMRHSVQPEVQKYLEAVFAVAPFPEEYVRYRLHLATALPLPLIDSWFEKRRQTHQKTSEDGVSQNGASNGTASAAAETSGMPAATSNFSLFGGSVPPTGNVERIGALAQRPTEEVAHVGRTLAMMQSHGGEQRIQVEAGTGGLFDTMPGHIAPMPGPAMEAPPAQSKLQLKASSRDEPAASNSRFGEGDLDIISALVGLETITSTEEHCGSRSLYMFEQLTALDSLDMDSVGVSKRRRTRHQHFWRNTDKLDPEERVYVPTSSIKPALKRRECVFPKRDISPEERTNAWTVCLTTRGVVGYLNKRISPLGVRMIRALQASTAAAASNAAVSQQQPWGNSREGSAAGLRVSSGPDDPSAGPQRPKRQRRAEEAAWATGRDGSASNGIPSTRSNSAPSDEDEEGGSPDQLQRHRQQQLEAATTLTAALGSAHAPAFEPIPRARKRKPG